jgi:hypothetical protein
MTTLVVDFKNHTVPTTISAVCNRAKDLAKDLGQVADYVSAISSDPNTVQRCTGVSMTGFSIKGVVLLLDPIPVPIPPHHDVLVCNWRSISASMDSDVGASFLESVVATSPTADPAYEITQQKTRVRGWTYKRFVSQYGNPRRQFGDA